MVTHTLPWVGSLISVDFDDQFLAAWRLVLIAYQPFPCMDIEMQSRLYYLPGLWREIVSSPE